MNIQRYALGQMQANCYVITSDSQCLIIDPADDASFILETIQSKNLTIAGILATHGHFDHVMAAGEIQLSVPSIPLHIHPADRFLLDRLGETAKYFLGFDPVVVKPQNFFDLKPGRLSVGKFDFTILETPGHTPGSICMYFQKAGVIFTGDTLFKDGIGRYDFSYSSKQDLKNSIKKILELPSETIIYPGHGEDSIIEEEKENYKKYFG